MCRLFVSLPVVLALAAGAVAQPKDAIKKVEVAVEPAQAKPGQTVTIKITASLGDGYFTYPVVQPAPEAKYSVNAITFPAGNPVVFVGETVDPIGPKTKKAEDHEYLIYPSGGTWIRKAVVPPTAKSGDATVKVRFRLMVCDEDRCFPPKPYDLEASLKVLDGPPVDVESKYKEEVENAQKK